MKGFPHAATLEQAHAGHGNPEAGVYDKPGGAGVVVGKMALELDQRGGKLGHGMALKANRMFTLCSYPKRPPLSLPIVGPEPKG